MNSYFSISHSCDPDVIGVSGGAGQDEIMREKFVTKSFFDDYVSYYETDDPKLHWKNRLAIPPFDIILEYVRLRKKAKLTDDNNSDIHPHKQGP